jgi:DNA polymerase-3 subunit epsilon
LDSQERIIETLRQNALADAARAPEDFRQARDDSRRQYDEIAENLDQRPTLSADEERELQHLWKKLVRLYHPDRFVNDPEKLQAYTNLTAAINLAKDTCDLETLREIAKDPAAFIARKGWSALDFGDSSDVAQLEKLYKTLLTEIEGASEALRKLRASSDYALYQAVGTSDKALADIVAKQKQVLEAEIAAIIKDTSKITAAIKQMQMDNKC